MINGITQSYLLQVITPNYLNKGTKGKMIFPVTQDPDADKLISITNTVVEPFKSLFNCIWHSNLLKDYYLFPSPDQKLSS
jgi:hypothetical protein